MAPPSVGTRANGHGQAMNRKSFNSQTTWDRSSAPIVNVMRSTQRSRIKTAALTTVGATCSALALAASPAAAQTPTPIPVAGVNVPLDLASGPQGYLEIFGEGTAYAGAINIETANGTVVRAFCIEAGTAYDSSDPDITLTGVPVTSARTADPDLIPQAMWIAANATTYDSSGNPIGATVGTPIGPDEMPVAANRQAVENTAAQLAIWKIVNDRDISSAYDPNVDANSPDNEFLVRANDFIDLVDGDDDILGNDDDLRFDVAADAYNTTITWEPAADSDGAVKVLATTTTGEVTAPAAGWTVMLTSEGSFDLDPATPGVQNTLELDTDNSGVARTAVLEATNVDSIVSVMVSADIEGGVILNPSADEAGVPRQQLAAIGMNVAEIGSVVVAAAPIPTTTAPPATTPPVTAPPVTAPPVTAPPVTAPPVTAPPVTAPPVTTPPADLPKAGPQTGMMFIVVTSLVGAAGLVLATRRRPSLPQAPK